VNIKYTFTFLHKIILLIQY